MRGLPTASAFYISIVLGIRGVDLHLFTRAEALVSYQVRFHACRHRWYAPLVRRQQPSLLVKDTDIPAPGPFPGNRRIRRYRRRNELGSAHPQPPFRKGSIRARTW